MALGIVNFIQTDYLKAADFYALAIKHNPTDHTLWNKYGACMSNTLYSMRAIKAYEVALDLRPNYVRTLVNLGLAYNRIKNLKSATNCFLNALTLNSHLTHVWKHLCTVLVTMNRLDLLKRA